MKNLGLILILSFLSSNGFSYNHKECHDYLYKNQPNARTLIGWVTSTTVSPTSTGQFLSSTGACRGINPRDNNAKEMKKAFLNFNYDHMVAESSRGKGEYLNAYASLIGCQGGIFGQSMYKNYQKVYGKNDQYLPDRVYQNIENLMAADEELKKACLPKL